MVGYSRLYGVGSLGGFMGVYGVTPIEFLVLVGNANRQWLEPHYFDRTINPIRKLRVTVPAKPDHPDALLDAGIAFSPRYFTSCSSLRRSRQHYEMQSVWISTLLVKRCQRFGSIYGRRQDYY